MHAKFVCGYQGESEYDVNGTRYAIRHRPGSVGVWMPGIVEREQVPFVGCVYRSHGRHEFPSAEVVALFPGFIGARWNADFSAVEYRDDARPDTTHDQFGLVVTVSACH